MHDGEHRIDTKSIVATKAVVEDENIESTKTSTVSTKVVVCTMESIA